MGGKSMRQSIITEQAPQPLGPYSQAVRVGEWLFISGQIPLDPKTNALITGDIAMQMEQLLKNVHAILLAAGATLDQVVKTTIYVTDMQKFQTINGVYGQWFKPPYPARAVVGVQALPGKAEVEMDVIALLKD
jgi:2-iminobutanoate/2-iminopropanoate deaminase